MISIESSASYQQREVNIGEYKLALLSHEAHSLIGPNNVILQVNYGCYLECQMCDRHSWVAQGASNEWSMTTNELDSLFEELSALGTKKITMVGTEPVMRPDLPEILSSIQKKGMKAELYTAGILLRDDVVESILDTGADVSFSVDGFYPNSHNGIRMPHHTFDAFGKTLASIHHLRQDREKRKFDQSQTVITANFTLQKGNVEDLATVSETEIDALGVDIIRISLVHGAGSYMLDRYDIPAIADFCARLAEMDCRTQVDLSPNILYLVNGRILPADFDKNVLVPSDAYHSKQKAQCHIGEMSTMIDPQGDVRPCLYLYDDNGPFKTSDRDTFILGNVRTQRFEDIWNGPAYQAFRKAYQSPHYEAGSRCSTCEYFTAFQDIDTALANGDNSSSIQVGW